MKELGLTIDKTRTNGMATSIFFFFHLILLFSFTFSSVDFISTYLIFYYPILINFISLMLSFEIQLISYQLSYHSKIHSFRIISFNISYFTLFTDFPPRPTQRWLKETQGRF